MQTMESLQAIIGDISFKDWNIRLDRYANEGPAYIQCLFLDKDRHTGNVELQRCRKWVLSFFMTDSEVVRTVFLAIQQAVVHEAQEEFKYRGARIYNPHHDYNDLASTILAHKIRVSVREEVPKS